MATPVYIEKEIAAALKASPDVSAICAGQVYPLNIPQGTVLPAVVYQRTGTAPHYTLSGYTSEGVTITINSFAMTFQEAKDLALAVRGAMAAAPLSAVFNGEQDLHEDDADAYCVSAKFTCQQYGGFCK